jgi:SRSO17 transposase
MAEAIGDKRPDRMERLLYRVDWDADKARDILEQFVIETLGDPEGIGVVDETGFIKKGEKSVGVKRQYTGTAGKVDNSQVGTFLTYASPKGHAFLDRRLFLPEDWAKDRCRRKGAKVPDAVVFEKKPEQALSMLEHAWRMGAPMRWVTGDEIYGDSPGLRKGIETSGHWYVMAVSSDTPVWKDRPAVEEPGKKTGGRRRSKARLAPNAPRASTVAEVVLEWPLELWHRFSVAEGEKGPRVYDWGRARVVESRGKLPGPDVWLLARRSVAKAEEIAYYLCLAPQEIALSKLAEVASTRYTIEQCFEEGKGEAGLDHYEVRYWHSWHRHITLSMMAHAWLTSIRILGEGKKRSGASRVNGSGSETTAGDSLASAASFS